MPNYFYYKLSYIYIKDKKFYLKNIFRATKIYNISEFKMLKSFFRINIIYFKNGEKAYFSFDPYEKLLMIFSKMSYIEKIRNDIAKMLEDQNS